MAEAPELPHIYVVTCIDDQTCGRAEAEPRGGCKKRIENYGAHKAYQAETAREGSPVFIKKLCAGPMVSEDGKYMVGSHFIVEATRSRVDAFVDNDPFRKHGVWQQCIVNRYISVVGIATHAGNL